MRILLNITRGEWAEIKDDMVVLASVWSESDTVVEGEFIKK